MSTLQCIRITSYAMGPSVNVSPPATQVTVLQHPCQTSPKACPMQWLYCSLTDIKSIPIASSGLVKSGSISLASTKYLQKCTHLPLRIIHWHLLVNGDCHGMTHDLRGQFRYVICDYGQRYDYLYTVRQPVVNRLNRRAQWRAAHMAG